VSTSKERKRSFADRYMDHAGYDPGAIAHQLGVKPPAPTQTVSTQTQLMRILEVALDDILKQFPVGYDCRITELAGGALATLETWKQNPGDVAPADRNAVIEEVALWLEDDRYNKPGREAEWSRHLARSIRLHLKHAPAQARPDAWASAHANGAHKQPKRRENDDSMQIQVYLGNEANRLGWKRLSLLG
jgi:hypothetical protein